MALTNLTILKYNNYYNRLYVQPSTDDDGNNFLADYTDGLTEFEDYETFETINFFKGDYINAEVVLNATNAACDYLIETDPVTNVVLTRWFIIENDTIRQGQSKFTLRRDVFVDYRDEYMEAPAFIEKATVGPDDVAIYNQEDISFNQIKNSETELKDNTKTPWIVGYYAPKDATITDKTVETTIIDVYGSYSTLQDFYDAINYDSEWRVIKKFDTLISNMVMKPIGQNRLNFYQYNYLRDTSTLTNEYTSCDSSIKDVGTTASERRLLAEDLDEAFKDYYNSLVTDIKALDLFNYHREVENVYIQINNVYKVVKFTRTQNLTGEYEISGTPLTNYNTMLTGRYGSDYEYTTGQSSYKALIADYIYDRITVTVEDATVAGYKVNIPATSRKLQDAPYKMFAMPLDSITVLLSGGTTFTTPTRNDSLNIASEIAIELGGTNNYLYDIQLLPYCPFRDVVSVVEKQIKLLSSKIEHYDYEFIKDTQGTTNTGVILFPHDSSFTFDINETIELSADATQRKIVNQCDKYRLCSPNYAASFDFNLVKTGGLKKFNVDCTYKPYNPYIHINPVWGNLYGTDFDDIRGLIVQGDFSIPVINDQWKNYQINNKNYLNSFNRNIESVELSNKYAKIQDVANAVTGTASGAMSGASAGAKLGGGYGAAIGAVVGGTASGAAGAYSVSVNEKLRNDALDRTKDNFRYNMQNIQAMPMTLGKVSSFDKNNKMFPVLEYYTCTDQEKEIFENKIMFDGMTVMRIGTVSEFLKNDITFIKGQFIMIPDLHDDYHAAATLAEEFYKGVFIK